MTSSSDGVMDVADGPVKETGADGAIGFNHCGSPRRVAAGDSVAFETEMSAKMPGDAAKLFGRLRNVTGIDVSCVFRR